MSVRWMAIPVRSVRSGRRTVKFPHEFKVMRVRECVAPSELIDTPEKAVAYWKANLPAVDWIDPNKEMFVVLVLNTRRRLIGHNLVTIGSLDTCVVRLLEVFRPVIMAAGAAAIPGHNHPSGDPTPSEADIKLRAISSWRANC